MEIQWSKLSSEEKREWRFKRWLSPSDIKFFSPEAEKAYKERVTRFIKAIKLEEHDRVPVILPAGNFPAFYAGITLHTVMYDYNELRRAWLKFLHEFDMDTFSSPRFISPGRVMEALDDKLYKWPGHGLPENITKRQYVEDEYMKANEYDELLKDPSDYAIRVHLPRSMGLFKPFKNLRPSIAFRSMIGGYADIVDLFAEPDFRTIFQTLIDVSEDYKKWRDVVREISQIAQSEGYPSISGGGAGAPFDRFADFLRGTHGIILDMYRQPDKLIEAMERLLPIMIESAINGANASNCPIIMMPLHKGDDTFMSNQHFEKFYWPTLRKLLIALINEGFVPMPFAEGRYNNRLDQIKDLPKGSVVWYFDQTDMTQAKEVLGKICCIAGNVPSSLLHTGTPQAVKAYCCKLIEICGKGGGFILTGGAGIDKGNPNNLRVMMDAARECALKNRKVSIKCVM